MSREGVRRALGWGLTAAAIVLAAVFLHKNREHLGELSRLTPGQVLLLLLATVLFFASIGLTFSALVGLLGVRLSPLEWLGLTVINTAVNYLGPVRPGVFAKAAYLKQKKRMPYARFSAVLAANGFLLFFYSGSCGLVLLALGGLQGGRAAWLLALLCLALIAASLAPFLLRFRGLERPGRVGRVLNSALEGFREIRAQRAGLAKVGGLVLLQYLLGAWVNWIAYRSLGVELSFLTALTIGVFTSISNFFTLTPNNLGLQEMVMAYLCTVAGSSFKSGLLGAGLMRAAHLLVAFTLAPVFTWILWRTGKTGGSKVEG